MQNVCMANRNIMDMLEFQHEFLRNLDRYCGIKCIDNDCIIE